MKQFEKVPAVLMLEDGTVFHGKSSGKIGTTWGEICFNTSMTGYQEVFTDPSYFGQILVMTNAHIGNYGTSSDEIESDGVKIAGLVCRNFTNLYSRKPAKGDLQSWLLEQNLIAISNVDTRAIVRHIRDKGAMNCIISSETSDLDELRSKLDEVPSMAGLELASKVSTPKAYFYGKPDAKYKVAVLDLGVKKSILKCLAERNCYLQVFPAESDYNDMKSWQPDAWFVSNGPGDPAAMDYAVDTVKAILNANEPLFGICLGHQILALACGIKTYKLHNGHRGANHPVLELETGRCEVTSQNHGFGADPKSVKASELVTVTHVNLNDQTIEGIRVNDKTAFSVQYHPEASPGPHDSRYLFDRFVDMMSRIEVQPSIKA